MFDDSNDDVNKDTIIYYNTDADKANKDDNYDGDDDEHNTYTTTPTFVPLWQNKTTATTQNFVPVRQDTTKTFVPLRQNNMTMTNPNFVPLQQDKNKTFFMPLRQNNTTTMNLNFLPLRQDKTKTFVPLRLRQDNTTTTNLNFSIVFIYDVIICFVLCMIPPRTGVI